MREQIRDKGRLEHMLEAIDNVIEFTNGVTLEGLSENKILRHAIYHNIQIIGEASYMISKEFKSQHPEVEWRVIEGMRHVLVHDYYKVRVQEAWNIVKDDIPPLRKQIEDCIREL